MQSIALIGPSGVGKTTVGLLLAEKLNLLYYDNDSYFQNNWQLTTSEFYSKFGLYVLHRAEHLYTLKNSKQLDSVFSVPAGALDNPQAKQALTNCTVIYLQASSQQIAYQTFLRGIDRPLASTDVNKVDALLTNRRHVYLAAANFTVTITNKTPVLVCEEILDFIHSLQQKLGIVTFDK